MDASYPRILLYLVKRIGPGIEDLDGVTAQSDATDEGARTGSNSDVPLDPFIVGGKGMIGSPSVLAIVKAVDRCLISPSQSDGCCVHSLQNRR